MSTFEGIYLDHSATTPLKPAVRDLMLEILDFPGNSSSIHKAGREARRRIDESRAQIARFLNADAKAVTVFTSGATEANNMVLNGAGVERVMASAIEHASVLQTGTHEIIPALPSGLVDVDALEKMLRGNNKQTLISVMLVNNETGVIQPLDKIVELAKKYGALVHTDAVQAAGKMPLDMQKLGVDYLTLSSHKIGGPQGVGCLVMANCASVSPLLSGGSQENNLRAGTTNLAGIVGFGKAMELAEQNLGVYQRLSHLRDRIESALQKAAPQLKIWGKESPRVVNTIMFSLPDASSETQMISLDLAGICVSNGSACASGTVKPSHVLKAMGASDEESTSSLRISLGWNTTEKDVDYFIEKWTEMYNRIKTRTSAA